MSNAVWLVWCLSPLPVCFIFIMSFSFPWNLWHIHQQCDKLDMQWNRVWLRARGRLDPLQSYPAITISSFLWGNTQRRERKLDKILLKKVLEWQGKKDETEHFPLLPKHLWICPEINAVQFLTCWICYIIMVIKVDCFATTAINFLYNVICVTMFSCTQSNWWSQLGITFSHFASLIEMLLRTIKCCFLL